MRGKLTITLVFALALTCLSLPATAQAREKRVIIGFHKSLGQGEESLVHGKRGKVRHKLRRIKAIAASLPEEEIAALAQDARVAYIEEDAYVLAIDPMYEAEYAASWGVTRIGSADAHQANIKGADIKVAILDTGVDFNHPDLAGRIAGGVNLVSPAVGLPAPDPANFMDDNSNGHGTHVAGVIAANLDTLGVVGVAPEAAIYAVKVLGGSGFGQISDIAAGVQWAIENGMDVINMSLGIGGTPENTLRMACEDAYQAGIVLVAAAGNRPFPEPVQYPAAYPEVIAVTASSSTDQIAGFAPTGSEIEIAAPGVAIWSTTSSSNWQTTEDYYFLSGSSQATPHVAGAAALILAAGIADTNGQFGVADEVRLRLQQTAQDFGTEGLDDSFGYGLVDVIAALGLETPPEPPVDPPDTNTITLTRGRGAVAADALQVPLGSAPYLVTIASDGLRRVAMEVMENGVPVEELERTYTFRRKKNNQVQFVIDGTDRVYDVVFTPIGKSGRSAEITLSAITAGTDLSEVLGSMPPTRVQMKKRAKLAKK